MLITVAGPDEKFCSHLRDILLTQSHRVTVLKGPDGVLEAIVACPPDLLVLCPTPDCDIVAPFLKELRGRAATRLLPVLCVNPRGGAEDGVVCLDAGADDFMNRPFNPKIFLARVRVLLRRHAPNAAKEEENVTMLCSGPVTLKLVARQALVAGVAVSLTRLEFDLLAFLMRAPEQVFKREEILHAVWNYPESVETRTLDKHVETLRKKLGTAGALVQTVHGVGYRFSTASAPAVSSAIPPVRKR